jgi:O-antigen ligase
MNNSILFAKRISCLLFVAVLPFWPILSSLALIPLAATHLLFKKSTPASRPYHLLWFTVPFFGYALTFIYAHNPQEAGLYMIRILPILIFPILFLFQDRETLPSRQTIMSWFVYGMLLSAVFAITLGLFAYLRSGDPGVFTYYELAGNMRQHPTYYSLYTLTGLVFLWSGNFRMATRTLASIILIVLLLLLQSRISILLLLFAALVYILFMGRKSMARLIIVAALLLGASYIAIKMSSRISGDLAEMVGHDGPLIGNLEENGITQRIWLWREALPQIFEKPLLGYGLKSQHAIFRWKIHREGLKNDQSQAYRNASWEVSKLNLHNQYLQALYEGGVLGLLLLIIPLITLLYMGFRLKNGDFQMAFAIFLVILVTENLLDRQMGIFFYGVFMPLMYLADRKPQRALTIKYNRFKRSHEGR